MEVTDIETRTSVAKYISDYICHVDINEIVIKEISNGMINTIYLCTVKNYNNNCSTRKLLLHIYGNDKSFKKETQAVFTEAEETIIVNRLSQIGIAPKVYAFFKDGRIEEFIDGRNLQLEDFRNERLMSEIARKIACIHSQDIPIGKEAKLFKFFGDRMKVIKKQEFSQQYNGEYHEAAKLLNDFDISVEWQWLFFLIRQFNAPLVFSHNDLNFSNILLRKQSEADEIFLIDYDLTCYNHRAYDIAYFLLHKRFRMNVGNRTYHVIVNEFDDEMDFDRKFLMQYLNECRKLTKNFHFDEKFIEQMELQIKVLQSFIFLIFISLGQLAMLIDTNGTYTGMLNFRKVIKRYFELKSMVKSYEENLGV